MLTGYDSTTAADLPADGQLYFGYQDGLFANVREVRARFPRVPVLSVAVSAATDADALDVERGDARPDQAAGWVARQLGRGALRPVIYASQSVIPQILADLSAAGIGRDRVRLWAAHYTSQHLCSPGACQSGFTADATQWAGSPGNSPGHYDITYARDTFADPLAGPAPEPTTKEDDMPGPFIVQPPVGTKGGTFLLGLTEAPLAIGSVADMQAWQAAGAKVVPQTLDFYKRLQAAYAKSVK